MRRSLLILFLLVPFHHALAAQGHWSMTLERGFTTVSSTAHDTSSPVVRLVPWHPTFYTLRLAKEGDRHGFALALTYGNGELAGTVDDAVIIPGISLDVAEVAPELSYRFATTPNGAVLRAHLGPVLDLWFPSGDDMRTTWGGQVGTTLTLPLSANWAVALRGDFTLTTGEVKKDEATAEIIRESTLRRGRLGLGITKHL